MICGAKFQKCVCVEHRNLRGIYTLIYVTKVVYSAFACHATIRLNRNNNHKTYIFGKVCSLTVWFLYAIAVNGV